jgi:hypothetical protein
MRVRQARQWKVSVPLLGAVEALIRTNQGLQICAYVDILKNRRSRITPAQLSDALNVLRALGKIQVAWNGFDNLYYPGSEA